MGRRVREEVYTDILARIEELSGGLEREAWFARALPPGSPAHRLGDVEAHERGDLPVRSFMDSRRFPRFVGWKRIVSPEQKSERTTPRDPDLRQTRYIDRSRAR